MKGWLCPDPRGVDALEWHDELPQRAPAAGEILVSIEAACLNFPDLLVLQGRYQYRPDPPFVPGAEFAGTVQAVGAGVQDLQPGDRVAVTGACDGFASHAVVAAHRAVVLDPGMDPVDASTFVLAYGTAHHALADRGRLQPGETVLILGAAGGVGLAALQVAQAMGARVLAAAGGAERCARLAGLGVEGTIDYRRDDAPAHLRAELRRLTGGRGVDVVVDLVGGALSEPAFRSLAWRGRHLVVGFAAGDIPALKLNLPLLKGAELTGVFWGAFTEHEPRAARATLRTLQDWYRDGRLRPIIDSRWPLRQLPQALARLQGRQAFGKVVLLPAPA
jgi:NADPH2:quinone reductase